MGRRQWDYGYSFRSADFAGEHDEGRPCARGEHCASGVRQRLEDGTSVRTPARSRQAFCLADWDLIGECLKGFPDLHGRLAAHVGDFFSTEILVRAPFGPSVPLRLDIDGLMRHMTDVACSWHERVASADPGLSVPDTQQVHARELGMRSGTLLPHPCKVLGERLTTLLGMEPGPMSRPSVSWLWVVIPDAIVTSAWRGTVTIELSGADAGNEILRLDYLGRAALLETEPGPERLLGVPCRRPGCEMRTLRRAQPPQHDGDPEYHSQCVVCGDLLTAEEYRQWTRLSAAYYGERVTPAQRAAGIAA